MILAHEICFVPSGRDCGSEPGGVCTWAPLLSLTPSPGRVLLWQKAKEGWGSTWYEESWSLNIWSFQREGFWNSEPCSPASWESRYQAATHPADGSLFFGLLLGSTVFCVAVVSPLSPVSGGLSLPLPDARGIFVCLLNGQWWSASSPPKVSSSKFVQQLQLQLNLKSFFLAAWALRWEQFRIFLCSMYVAKLVLLGVGGVEGWVDLLFTFFFMACSSLWLLIALNRLAFQWWPCLRLPCFASLNQ